ncbi:MAG: T9SS type A sorting domain-containing protein [Bacteroidota bacterium]|nr:T9SS type A sorting domain-containing protein [Bacteroidota bacterium]
MYGPKRLPIDPNNKKTMKTITKCISIPLLFCFSFFAKAQTNFVHKIVDLSIEIVSPQDSTFVFPNSDIPITLKITNLPNPYSQDSLVPGDGFMINDYSMGSGIFYDTLDRILAPGESYFIKTHVFFLVDRPFFPRYRTGHRIQFGLALFDHRNSDKNRNTYLGDIDNKNNGSIIHFFMSRLSVEESNKKKGLQVFPQPYVGEGPLYVALPKGQAIGKNFHGQLFNALGQKVGDQKGKTKNPMKLSMPKIPNGFYTLQLQIQQNHYVQKILVQ